MTATKEEFRAYLTSKFFHVISFQAYLALMAATH